MITPLKQSISFIFFYQFETSNVKFFTLFVYRVHLFLFVIQVKYVRINYIIRISIICIIYITLHILHILFTELNTGWCESKEFISICKIIINQLLHYNYRKILSEFKS